VESLGEKLRTAREDKGYSYDQASRETNIAARYLEALEKEDFAKFPGEPYLLGFLRNYGDYLGLDAQELLNLYRALKIQEQPVPVEQLLRGSPQTPKIIRIIVILALALGAAGTGVYFIINAPRKEVSQTVEVRAPITLTMDGPFLERRLYQGDMVLIPMENSQLKLTLAHLGETVTITTPAGQEILDLGMEVMVDLNMDGTGDLRITVADFVKNDSASGAVVRFDLENLPPAYDAGPDAASGDPAVSPGAQALSSAPVYFTSVNPYPFTLQAAFQGYCMFRWQILGERDRPGRNEQYFQRGEDLNVQAQNGIRLWLSNAASVKLQLIGGGRDVPVELGGPGEVAVADIRWVRDEEGRYRLVLLSLD
jgi:cytoskeletal protein RodZ